VLIAFVLSRDVGTPPHRRPDRVGPGPDQLAGLPDRDRRRRLLHEHKRTPGPPAPRPTYPGVTEYAEIPGRGHSLTIDGGWREVCDTALAFVKRVV
jgi:hypothetical protein